MDFAGFGIATTSALLQILEILSRRKQEEKKSCKQKFKAAEAWSKSSEQMESGPGALPVLNVGGQQQILPVKNCQRYLLHLLLWPSKGQTLLERQIEITCGQQPRIPHF